MPKSALPQWFIDAVSAPLQSRALMLGGCALNYFVWGEPSKPAITWWCDAFGCIANEFKR